MRRIASPWALSMRPMCFRMCPELFKWLTGQERPPPRVANNDAFDQIYEHVTKILLKNSDEASRTCPGRSWLRGWDNWSPEAHEKNSRS